MKLYILRTETKENRYWTESFEIFKIETRALKLHINTKSLKLDRNP